MKKLLILTCLIASASILASSQTPTPGPKRDDDVVKITTSLIQIDVSVTDAKGNPVTDLKREDFEIYENGEKQKISGLSFVAAGRKIETAERPAADKVGVPVPPVSLRAEQVRRTVALVVDDLSLSFESTYQVRRSLKRFVDEQMQDGDLVAIIRTGAGVGALQQFTSDKRLLYAAIDKVRWNPLGSGKIGAFAPIEPTPLQQLKSAGDASITDEELEDEKNSINYQNDFRSSVFATGTLGALRYIVTGMGELPGRKSVILFSDGFRLFERDRQGTPETGRVLEFLKQLIDMANRASVVVYSVDPRGLQTTGFTAQDQIADTSPDAMNSLVADRRNELFETQDGLRYLSRQTGGFAVVNNNDIIGGVRRVLEDQSYYLIGYEPDSDTFDPAKHKFNRLDVKVIRKDVNVRYRSGFFGIADTGAIKKPFTQTPLRQIQTALVSPFSVNSIALRLNALFGNDARNGSFVRSLLHVNAKDLKFIDQPDGNKKATFDVLAASFGDNGQVVDQLGRSYTINISGKAYENLLSEGFVYQFTFPVKKPGAYQYRVALRDSQAGIVGSASQFIEVPNLKKNRLTMSGIVLENLTAEQWKQFTSSNTPPADLDAMADTALRRARAGSVLRYGFEIYNARAGTGQMPNVSYKVRIFREGNLVLDGKQTPLEFPGQTDSQRLKSSGALSLGSSMAPGDYVLQVIVIDNNAKEKERLASQYVQFEVY
jgi:VWFA-related protein